MRDLFNGINPIRCISPVVISDNTPSVGAIIDRQGFDSVTYMADVDAMRDAVTPNTIALIASAPGYSQGVVDPIRAIGGRPAKCLRPHQSGGRNPGLYLHH